MMKYSVPMYVLTQSLAFCRVSSGDTHWVNVPHDDGSGKHNRTTADCDPWHHKDVAE